MSTKAKEKTKGAGIIDATKVYTIEALAEEIGRARATVREFIAEGLPHFRRGNLILVTGAAFARFVEERSTVEDKQSTSSKEVHNAQAPSKSATSAAGRLP